MLLPVRLPNDFDLKAKIANKYLSLYREYRRYYPQRKDYTYRQLRQNIAIVASIINSTVESHSLHNSTFIPWLENDWKQLYFNHWYFALTVEEVNGTPTAIIQDAHYEGDHHNDILLSKPYDEDDLIR